MKLKNSAVIDFMNKIPSGFNVRIIVSCGPNVITNIVQENCKIITDDNVSFIATNEGNYFFVLPGISSTDNVTYRYVISDKTLEVNIKVEV